MTIFLFKGLARNPEIGNTDLHFSNKSSMCYRKTRCFLIYKIMGWTLDAWYGHLDSGRLDVWILDVWTQDVWTLDV